MLTTSADVMGFLTLSPISAFATEFTARGAGSNDTNAAVKNFDQGEEYLLETPCWNIDNRQWVLRHSKSSFGYARHERFAMYCDRVSDSFMINVAGVASATKRSPSTLFDASPEMRAMAFADFWMSLWTRNSQLVNRSVQPPTDPVSKQLAAKAPTRIPGYSMIGLCSECLLKQLPWLGYSDVERITIGFAEKYQVEAYFGTRLASPINFVAPVPFASAAKRRKRAQVDGGTLPNSGHLQCVKSGGIYGHSNRGLFSPLCHRYQRQRDFKYFADLWMDPSALGGKSKKSDASGKPAKRYGISLHHGNLFGALRMGVELLWETDGDLDLIAFDDTHGEMMSRFENLKKQAEKDGFEVKVTYPEKPWYTSFLKDKTDFQLNARSVLDPKTRGKPPHMHNVSVMYQGHRCYVNGFQNPWQSIRTDPGHDYRDHYLAQQGWVLHFTNASVACGVPGHPACLPTCNHRHHLLDHNYCAPDAFENLDIKRSPGAQHLPVIYRDPILWHGAEGEEEVGEWITEHNWEFF